ncbi:MAG: hypothetical protein CL916_04025 [Deltaproteobacteria bacterium]|nr:hypothetical protein [Deltaproteobacteria bacterium]
MVDFYLRVLDVFFALIALIALSPLLGIAALLVRSTGRPIIFRQKRNGRKGRVFTIYKFRTMRVMEDGDENFKQASIKDDRTTAVGAFLRHYSIDELPQLLNILKGDMSIVGSRPHALAHDRQFVGKIEDYMRRYALRPGLTGLAQVRRFRGPTDTLEKMVNRVRSDLEYIDNRSVQLYLDIIFQTAMGPYKQH